MIDFAKWRLGVLALVFTTLCVQRTLHSQTRYDDVPEGGSISQLNGELAWNKACLWAIHPTTPAERLYAMDATQWNATIAGVGKLRSGKYIMLLNDGRIFSFVRTDSTATGRSFSKPVNSGSFLPLDSSGEYVWQVSNGGYIITNSHLYASNDEGLTWHADSSGALKGIGSFYNTEAVTDNAGNTWLAVDSTIYIRDVGDTSWRVFSNSVHAHLWKAFPVIPDYVIAVSPAMSAVIITSPVTAGLHGFLILCLQRLSLRNQSRSTKAECGLRRGNSSCGQRIAHALGSRWCRRRTIPSNY